MAFFAERKRKQELQSLVAELAGTERQAIEVYMKMTPPAPGTDEEKGALYDLHDAIRDRVQGARAGVVGGFDFERGRGYVYAYGPDARRMLEVALPALEGRPGLTHARLVLGDVRDENAPEETVDL